MKKAGALVVVAVVVLAVWILLKALFAVGVALNYLLPALSPFIAAFVFSIIMEPIIGLLQRKGRFPRGLAVFVAMIILFGGMGFILTVVLVKLVAELIQVSHSLPGAAAELMVYAEDLINQAVEIYANLPAYITTSMEQNITSIATNVQGLVTNIANSIINCLSAVPGAMILFMVSAIATYFIARDRKIIAKRLYDMIPAPWDEKTAFILKEVSAGFGRYMKAQLIIMSITMVISIIGLYILRADYVLTIGLLAGVMEILPVLGPGMVYVPWMIWALITGNIAFAVKLAILYGFLLVVRQAFEARIVSANLGLYPLTVLIAMYAGLKLIGASGIFIGPIALVALQAVIKSGVFKKQQTADND